MTTLKGLQNKLAMYPDYVNKVVVFEWCESNSRCNNLFELFIPFSKWAYMTDRIKKEKLHRFLRYAKLRGRVTREKAKESRGE